MIRPFTCVCALLAGASGLYLYSEKHRTTLLDQHISRVVADTQVTRERTAILRAEWELLNQPDRLGTLAARYLPQLQPMAPTQFVQLASLDKRLPAPGPETPPHPIATPTTEPGLVGQVPATAPATPTAAAADATAIAQADTHPDTRADTHVAAARQAGSHRAAAARRDIQLVDDADGTPSVVPQAALRRVASHTAIHAGHGQLAQSESLRDAVRRAWAQGSTQGATHQASAPATRYAAYETPHAVASVGAYARPAPLAVAAWRPVRATWPAPRPVSYTAPQVGSSLGSGHASLAAPVPLSDGN